MLRTYFTLCSESVQLRRTSQAMQTAETRYGNDVLKE